MIRIDHHAILYCGDRDKIIDDVLDEIRSEIGNNLESHPDIFIGDYPTLLIEHSRNLIQMSSLSPIEAPKRYFIISVGTANIYAQNALLKMIEEPSELCKFYFIATDASVFIPTVVSRMHVIHRTVSSEEFGKKFIASNIKDRLILVEKMIKEIKDGDASKREILNLMDNLEKISAGNPKKYFKLAKSLILARRYILDQGANSKMLLEHIALSI